MVARAFRVAPHLQKLRIEPGELQRDLVERGSGDDAFGPQQGHKVAQRCPVLHQALVDGALAGALGQMLGQETPYESLFDVLWRETLQSEPPPEVGRAGVVTVYRRVAVTAPRKMLLNAGH